MQQKIVQLQSKTAKRTNLPSEVIKYAVATEKSIRMMEYENKLQFVVALKARKSEIKTALQTMFNIKIKSVNTYISRAGEKRAIITLPKEIQAIDIGTQIGIM